MEAEFPERIGELCFCRMTREAAVLRPVPVDKRGAGIYT